MCEGRALERKGELMREAVACLRAKDSCQRERKSTVWEGTNMCSTKTSESFNSRRLKEAEFYREGGCPGGHQPSL